MLGRSRTFSSNAGTNLVSISFLAALAVFSSACNGPLPFMSGGQLGGEEREAPDAWALDQDFGVVQLETRPEEPYSVNIAYTLVDDTIYLNAGDTETQWVKNMNDNPLVRLRFGDTIYTLRAERVTDPAKIERFAKAWTDHSVFHRDPTQLDPVWIYQLIKP